MRVSDADREQAAEVLREAAGQGRISMDELDERLELAYAAKTYADLAAVTRDLPQHGAALSPAGGMVPAGRIGGTPRNKFSVAIMSGARRMGSWVVPRRYVAVAVMGGVELDLRDGQFSEPEVTLHAYTLMGGIQITVPEDVDVDVSGIAFMGGFDHNASGPGVPGAPSVKVIGFALMGGVEVRRKGAEEQAGRVRAVGGRLTGRGLDGGSQGAIEGLRPPGLAAGSAVEAEHHGGPLDDVVLAQRPDRGADREELGGVRAPGVAVLAQLHPDDALRVERLGLGLHPAHGQLAGVVERLGELLELDVRADVADACRPAAGARCGRRRCPSPCPAARTRPGSGSRSPGRTGRR